MCVGCVCVVLCIVCVVCVVCVLLAADPILTQVSGSSPKLALARLQPGSV